MIKRTVQRLLEDYQHLEKHESNKHTYNDVSLLDFFGALKDKL